MKTKHLYFGLCLLGLVLPYWQFVPWVVTHGLNFTLFVREMFANRISAFFGMDVLASAVALVVFMRIESRRSHVRYRWLPIVALCVVGVSLALPLYLYLRESALEGVGSMTARSAA